MPVTNIDQLDALADRLAGLFAHIAPDLPPVGTAAAEAIVRTTLDGVGADDKPFAPYSAPYAARLAKTAKSPDAVNLRGVFPPTPPGGTGTRGGRSAKGKGGATAGRVPLARYLPAVTARTPSTDLTDPASELSLDLITVTTDDAGATLTYRPRADGHMLDHQLGTATLPARPWFSTSKTAVRAAATAAALAVLAGRADRFRQGR